MVVPNRAQPGEPQRRRFYMDYQVLNNLLSPVVQVYSKAKGVFILVPLLKIDEMYAKLVSSRIYSTLDLRGDYYHIA